MRSPGPIQLLRLPPHPMGPARMSKGYKARERAGDPAHSPCPATAPHLCPSPLSLTFALHPGSHTAPFPPAPSCTSPAVSCPWGWCRKWRAPSHRLCALRPAPCCSASGRCTRVGAAGACMWERACLCVRASTRVTWWACATWCTCVMRRVCACVCASTCIRH